MFCSVQWCMGENDTTRGSFSWRNGKLGLGLGAVAGDHLGGRPVVVIGNEHVLAEQLVFQGGARVLVDAPGKAQVLGLPAVQLPGDHPPHPGPCGDLPDFGFDLLPGPAGFAAGESGGQLVQLLRGLGEGGAGEPAGLGGVQFG